MHKRRQLRPPEGTHGSTRRTRHEPPPLRRRRSKSTHFAIANEHQSYTSVKCFLGCVVSGVLDADRGQREDKGGEDRVCCVRCNEIGLVGLLRPLEI